MIRHDSSFETVADDFWIVETSPSGRKKLFCARTAVSFYNSFHSNKHFIWKYLINTVHTNNFYLKNVLFIFAGWIEVWHKRSLIQTRFRVSTNAGKMFFIIFLLYPIDEPIVGNRVLFFYYQLINWIRKYANKKLTDVRGRSRWR